MDFELSDAEKEFRDEVRAWLKANAPHDAEGGGDLKSFIERRRAWQKKLFDAGYVGMTWPEEYGGHGRSFMDQLIFNDEMILAHAPEPINVIGLGMGGPVVIAHGNDAQKKRYLEPLLSAEEIWCQGFSEPNAGSDLSGLQTRAEDHGDHYVVNGQKVWTTLAHVAKWCMLLARERKEANPRDGLTYLLVDMKSPGIEVRPLVQITGDAEFNEIFFKDVKVPKSQILGEAGQGWAVAMTTLLHERGGDAGPDHGVRAGRAFAQAGPGRRPPRPPEDRPAHHRGPRAPAQRLPGGHLGKTRRNPRPRRLDPQADVVGAQPAYDRDGDGYRGPGRAGRRRRRLEIPVPSLAREHDRGGNVGGSAQHPGRKGAGPTALSLT